MNPGSGVGSEGSANASLWQGVPGFAPFVRPPATVGGVSFVTGYFQTPLCLYPTLFCLTNDVSFQKRIL